VGKKAEMEQRVSLLVIKMSRNISTDFPVTCNLNYVMWICSPNRARWEATTPVCPSLSHLQLCWHEGLPFARRLSFTLRDSHFFTPVVVCHWNEKRYYVQWAKCKALGNAH